MALRDGGLSPASADHAVKLLRRALNLAVDWGMLDTNPAAKIPLFNVDNKVENYLSDEQLTQLLEVLRTDSNVAVCQIALFLLSTGCRLRESLSAKWTDVNLETNVLTVRATNSKSKKPRGVPLNASALEVLNALPSKGKYEHLFVNLETGKPYVTIARVWHRLRKKAGLPNLRLHDLRHSYASYLANDGQSLYLLQSILGHADPKMTMRYAHPSAKALGEAANSASVKILNGLKRAG
jgi:integrase